MADPRLQIIIEAVDKATDVLASVGGAFEKHRKAIGVSMTAVGGAITGVAALSVKAALEEEIGIKRLDAALGRVGEQYNYQKGAIESVIAAMQRKTNYGDGEQRAALESLITITGDYQSSLEALPMVLDIATALNMDLNSASLLVGKALEGNTSALSRYGITLEEGASKTDILAALTEKFAGSAESAADPMAQMQNQMGDVMEVLGGALLPILKDVMGTVAGVVERFQGWAEQNPELVRVLAIVVAALGGIMLVVGPILIALPMIAAGIGMVGAAITLAMGPVGLITLAIMGIVAVIILVVTHLEDIKQVFIGVWEAVQSAFSAAWDFIKSHWDTLLSVLGGPIGIFVVQFIKHWDDIKNAFSAAWEFIKDIAKSGINFVIGLAESWANSYIKAANFVVRALNSIKVTVPDWVPGIGGRSFGINIPGIPEIALPRLAQGGIVTRPTIAMIGERGPEAVIPLRGAMAGGVTINFNGPIYGLADFRDKVNRVVRDTFLAGGYRGIVRA